MSEVKLPEEYLNLSDETLNALLQSQQYLSDKLQSYHKAIMDSIRLDEFNVKEKSMVASGIAQAWITAYFAEEALLKQLERKKDDILESASSDTSVPKYKAIAAASTSEKIKRINNLIEDQKQVVRFLAESQKNAKNIVWDVKNVISILELER